MDSADPGLLLPAHEQGLSSASTLVDAQPSPSPEIVPPLQNTYDGVVEPEAPVVKGAISPVTVARKQTSRSKSTKPSLQSFPAYIPPAHTNRTLVLCFDGTGDKFCQENSNVVELFSMLKKDDKTKQMVYYQSGIGTYLKPQVEAKWHRKLSQTLDCMVAHCLDIHVMQGYEFLMKNYTDGDRICLFGFSRGAYIARALAGMLHKVGLLPADNDQQVPFAYKLYTDTSDEGWRQSNKFKRAFSLDVDIHFIGVWDTVDAVGIVPRRLPFTTSNTIVRTFRQALALDERRASFKANDWNYPTDREVWMGVQQQAVKNEHSPVHKRPWLKRRTTEDSVIDVEYDGTGELSDLEIMYSSARPVETDVYEVWFAGCHCDVGGGSVADQTPHRLSRIPLRWMIRETFKTNSGIMFDSEKLRRIGLDPCGLYKTVRDRPDAVKMARDETWRVGELTSSTWWSRLSSWWRRGGAISLAHAEEGRCVFSRRNDADGRVYIDVHGEDGLVTEGSEEEEDLKDALTPIYDQLQMRRGWWILEVLPMHFREQSKDGEWRWRWECNLGKARVIQRQQDLGVNVHRTVKTRMDSYIGPNGERYVPAARLRVEPKWVA